MEFMNVVRMIKGKQPIFNNCAKNTSIYIIRFAFKKGKGKSSKGYKLTA